MIEELAEFLVLAVGQCVHRVQHQRLDAPARSGAQHMVHDWHDVGEALARSGTCGEDVAPSVCSRVYGLDLMAMQRHLLAPRILVGLVLPEDLLRKRVQATAADQFVHGGARLEGGIQPDPGIRPEQPPVEGVVHRASDSLIGYLDEAL